MRLRVAPQVLMTMAEVLDAVALAQQLQLGQVAVIPTDTVPGLAAVAASADQIWRVKRRPADKPLILMSASETELFDVVSPECHHDARTLVSRHWPGALTLVLPAEGLIVEHLNPAGQSLGVRIPACPLTCELLRSTGPLATSSANPAGQPPAASAREAAMLFPDLPQLGPQPWPTHSGQASTVVRWCGLGTWRVLRQGAVILES